MTDGDRDDLLLAIAGGVVAMLEMSHGYPSFRPSNHCYDRARADQFQRRITDLVRTIQEEATEANWRMV